MYYYVIVCVCVCVYVCVYVCVRVSAVLTVDCHKSNRKTTQRASSPLTSFAASDTDLVGLRAPSSATSILECGV